MVMNRDLHHNHDLPGHHRHHHHHQNSDMSLSTLKYNARRDMAVASLNEPTGKKCVVILIQLMLLVFLISIDYFTINNLNNGSLPLGDRLIYCHDASGKMQLSVAKNLHEEETKTTDEQRQHGDCEKNGSLKGLKKLIVGDAIFTSEKAREGRAFTATESFTDLVRLEKDGVIVFRSHVKTSSDLSVGEAQVVTSNVDNLKIEIPFETETTTKKQCSGLMRLNVDPKRKKFSTLTVVADHEFVKTDVDVASLSKNAMPVFDRNGRMFDSGMKLSKPFAKGAGKIAFLDCDRAMQFLSAPSGSSFSRSLRLLTSSNGKLSYVDFPSPYNAPANTSEEDEVLTRMTDGSFEWKPIDRQIPGSVSITLIEKSDEDFWNRVLVAFDKTYNRVKTVSVVGTDFRPAENDGENEVRGFLAQLENGKYTLYDSIKPATKRGVLQRRRAANGRYTLAGTNVGDELMPFGTGEGFLCFSKNEKSSVVDLSLVPYENLLTTRGTTWELGGLPLVNVGDGTLPTDAVNVSQTDGRFLSKSYREGKLSDEKYRKPAAGEVNDSNFDPFDCKGLQMTNFASDVDSRSDLVSLDFVENLCDGTILRETVIVTETETNQFLNETTKQIEIFNMNDKRVVNLNKEKPPDEGDAVSRSYVLQTSFTYLVNFVLTERYHRLNDGPFFQHTADQLNYLDKKTQNETGNVVARVPFKNALCLRGYVTTLYPTTSALIAKTKTLPTIVSIEMRDAKSRTKPKSVLINASLSGNKFAYTKEINLDVSDSNVSATLKSDYDRSAIYVLKLLFLVKENNVAKEHGN